MTVRIEDGIVHLEGDCPVEDAETLLEALLADAAAPVDWSGCETLHSAVLQVLMAVAPALRGTPADPFLRRWVAPALPGGQTC